jgi:hypothetical protein
MLTAKGPMTLQQFVAATELSGVDGALFERFLSQHAHLFSKGRDDTYWFTGHQRPVARNYDGLTSALLYALGCFSSGASVEELHWFLCISTVGGTKTITRRSVSRELSRRSDLFVHVSRARYTLVPQAARRARSLPAGSRPPSDLVQNTGNALPIPMIGDHISIMNEPMSPDHGMADAFDDDFGKNEDEFDADGFFDRDFLFRF